MNLLKEEIYSTDNTLRTGMVLEGNAHMRVDVKDADGKFTSRTVWIRHDKENDNEKYSDVTVDNIALRTSQLIVIMADQKIFGRVGQFQGIEKQP